MIQSRNKMIKERESNLEKFNDLAETVKKTSDKVGKSINNLLSAIQLLLEKIEKLSLNNLKGENNNG